MNPQSNHPELEEQLEVGHWDLEVILRNVGELNKLVSENERTVEYVGENGAKFCPTTNIMHLTFYADGIQLDQGRFRPYAEKATRAFMKDLSDGFFPSELQVRFDIFHEFREFHISIPGNLSQRCGLYGG